MVFTAAQLTAFFTTADYLRLSARTAAAIAAEGITEPADLAEFDKEGLDAIFRNLRKPPRALQGGAGRGAAGRGGGGGRGLVDVEPFIVPAKSQMRIYASALAVKYYVATARELDPENMPWVVVQRFHEEWKAIVEKKKMDVPDAPKLTKGLAVYKWLESVRNHLNQVIGVRYAPLSYVIREIAAVNPVPPVLQLGEPFAEEYGSVEGEMIARLSHTHPLFKSDNGQVFDVIEAALRGTSISPSIAQFRKTRDGRAAYLALVSQHAGRDVWDKLQREAEHKLQNVKWNGQTTITLQQHMSMHRREWITLQDCSEYIPVEVPNGRQRVTWLMNSITSIDPGVLAAIAAVRQDEVDKRVNFESAVAYLAPVCPVAAKQQRRGKLEANVSGTTAGGLGSTGKTGVSLRYHKYAEFQKLSEEQKKELREWKTNNKTNGKRKSAPAGDKKATKKMKGMLAAFSAANTEAIQALVDSNSATVAAVAAGLGSTMGTQPKGAIGSVTTVTPTKTPAELMLAAEVAALKLKSILKGGESKDKKKSN